MRGVEILLYADIQDYIYILYMLLIGIQFVTCAVCIFATTVIVSDTFSLKSM